ncbi:MAG: CHAD domain-containing protein [Arenicellales bacterium]|nr:CHAD domain-containing protein [Arenicellales bacterium]
MARQLTTSVHREQTVESAFNHILRTNLASIERSEPVALSGKDIEGVHNIRVGLRRIRSALTVFRPVIPYRVTKPLAKDLRWAAKELDRARDLDVYIARNLSGKGKKSKAKMHALATQHRNKAYRRVRHLLKGKRYRGVKVRLGDWLDANTWHMELSKQQRKVVKRKVAPFASRVLEARRIEILKKGREIQQLDSEELHRLRIKCKKLRYATEFFEPVYGAQMKPFTKQLKEIQELLGTLHDIAVMTRLQQDLLKDRGNSKLKRVARKLEAQGQRETEIISDKLMRRWKIFSETKHPW